jgi:hypothetical protein
MENRIYVHHNAVCLKCGKIEEQMARVGALHFCFECVEKEFNTQDPVRQEREKYLKWLRKTIGYIDCSRRGEDEEEGEEERDYD